MPDREPTLPPLGDIRDQIVISFDVDLANNGFSDAIDIVTGAVGRLQDQHKATVLVLYINETSDEKAFFGLIVARLDNRTSTLEDLSKDSFLKIAHIERNLPIALAQYNDPLLFEQWALKKLKAADPWTVAPPGAGKTIVAIIDSRLFGVGPLG